MRTNCIYDNLVFGVMLNDDIKINNFKVCFDNGATAILSKPDLNCAIAIMQKYGGSLFGLKSDERRITIIKGEFADTEGSFGEFALMPPEEISHPIFSHKLEFKNRTLFLLKDNLPRPLTFIELYEAATKPDFIFVESVGLGQRIHKSERGIDSEAWFNEPFNQMYALISVHNKPDLKAPLLNINDVERALEVVGQFGGMVIKKYDDGYTTYTTNPEDLAKARKEPYEKLNKVYPLEEELYKDTYKYISSTGIEHEYHLLKT